MVNADHATGVLIIKPPLKSKIIKAEGNSVRNFENNKNLDKKSDFRKMKIIKARRRRIFFENNKNLREKSES